MKRVPRYLLAVVLLSASAGSVAQSFNQELARYRASKYDCEQAFRQRIERGCDAACRAAAAERQTRCLAAAERRYGDVLRRALRTRR